MPLPADDDLQLDRLLCFAVYSANLAFNRIYRPLLDRLGLTYVQYIVMVALWHDDDLMVGELGERLFLASNTLTPVIKRLEAMGHLGRQRDSVDERHVRVKLTAEGRALRSEAADMPSCVLTASGLDRSEAARLLGAVSDLRDHLLDRAGQDRGIAVPA